MRVNLPTSAGNHVGGKKKLVSVLSKCFTNFFILANLDLSCELFSVALFTFNQPRARNLGAE